MKLTYFISFILLVSVTKCARIVKMEKRETTSTTEYDFKTTEQMEVGSTNEKTTNMKNGDEKTIVTILTEATSSINKSQTTPEADSFTTTFRVQPTHVTSMPTTKRATSSTTTNRANKIELASSIISDIIQKTTKAVFPTSADRVRITTEADFPSTADKTRPKTEGEFPTTDRIQTTPKAALPASADRVEKTTEAEFPTTADRAQTTTETAFSANTDKAQARTETPSPVELGMTETATGASFFTTTERAKLPPETNSSHITRRAQKTTVTNPSTKKSMTQTTPQVVSSTTMGLNQTIGTVFPTTTRRAQAKTEAMTSSTTGRAETTIEAASTTDNAELTTETDHATITNGQTKTEAMTSSTMGRAKTTLKATSTTDNAELTTKTDHATTTNSQTITEADTFTTPTTIPTTETPPFTTSSTSLSSEPSSSGTDLVRSHVNTIDETTHQHHENSTAAHDHPQKDSIVSGEIELGIGKVNDVDTRTGTNGEALHDTDETNSKDDLTEIETSSESALRNNVSKKFEPEGGKEINIATTTYNSGLVGVNNTEVNSTGRDEMTVERASEEYTYSRILDFGGKFKVYWKFSGEEVIFEVHVQTFGYIGFGISRSGGMYPADIIMGGVKNGELYFADYHTIGNTHPVLDPSQDWTLLRAQENSEGTVLKFSRKLNTCDENDRKMVLNNQNINFIYAYHSEDIGSGGWFSYHGPRTRGRKEVSLQNIPHHQYADDVKLFKIYNTQFQVPSSGTHYRCQLVRFPKLDKQHHFISYENYIQPGNEAYVHHMGLYGCSQLDDSYDGYSFNCLEELIFMNYCRRFYTVSGVGSLPFRLPEHLGLPIGGPDDPTFLMLQTHYNNKLGTEGVVDSSGFHAYYTPNLRQYPAAVLITGELPRAWSEIVPPHYSNFMSIAHCGPECLTKAMPEGVDSIKGVAIAHHSHLLGRRVITRHIRDGVELKPIAEDKLFNFDYQGGAIILDEEVTIKKGDIIRVDCHYDSTEKGESFTYGGFGTANEMCATFMLYYPKMAIEQCYSMPVYSGLDSDPLAAAAKIKSWNFTDPIIRERFQELVEKSDYRASCMDGIQLPQTHLVPAPGIIKPFPSTVEECPSI